MKRTYTVEVTLSVDVVVDDAVFKSVLTDEWRSHFYPLRTEASVLEHLVFNLVQGRMFDQLDGFANLPGDSARVVKSDWMDWESVDSRGKALPR